MIVYAIKNIKGEFYQYDHDYGDWFVKDIYRASLYKNKKDLQYKIENSQVCECLKIVKVKIEEVEE